MSLKDLCFYILGERFHIRTNSYYDHVKEIENIIIYSKIPKSANRLLKCRFWISALFCLVLYMTADWLGFEIWRVVRGDFLRIYGIVLDIVDGILGLCLFILMEASFLQKAIRIIEIEKETERKQSVS